MNGLEIEGTSLFYDWDWDCYLYILDLWQVEYLGGTYLDWVRKMY